MQIVVCKNKVLAYGDDGSFINVDGTVVCNSTGKSFQNATIISTETHIPVDIDTVGYEYEFGVFTAIPSATATKGVLTFGSKTFNGSANQEILKSDIGLGAVDNITQPRGKYVGYAMIGAGWKRVATLATSMKNGVARAMFSGYYSSGDPASFEILVSVHAGYAPVLTVLQSASSNQITKARCCYSTSTGQTYLEVYYTKAVSNTQYITFETSLPEFSANAVQTEGSDSGLSVVEKTIVAGTYPITNNDISNIDNITQAQGKHTFYNMTSAGWKRIARLTSASVMLQVSSMYFSVTPASFTIMVSTGYRVIPVISVVSSSNGTPHFTKARIVYSTTADEKYLELYYPTSATGAEHFNILTAERNNETPDDGFIYTAETNAPAIPSGYTSVETDIVAGTTPLINGVWKTGTINSTVLISGKYLIKYGGATVILSVISSTESYGLTVVNKQTSSPSLQYAEYVGTLSSGVVTSYSINLATGTRIDTVSGTFEYIKIGD